MSRSVQGVSKVCPGYVQSMSRVCPEYVQGVSLVAVPRQCSGDGLVNSSSACDALRKLGQWELVLRRHTVSFGCADSICVVSMDARSLEPLVLS